MLRPRGGQNLGEIRDWLIVMMTGDNRRAGTVVEANQLLTDLVDGIKHFQRLKEGSRPGLAYMRVAGSCFSGI
ncbi:hypothetical protein Pmani_017771 [Petrolisthes manimaculis]|uniref:Uncharacterized protein n=1 Tax=Petrolisthes manimaculis TaxID=1843537 RepID=A0AAE1U7E6_9EUCA|nr:hypothetical protein Pmani_017771 [Petrolisthes manimaculis]